MRTNDNQVWLPLFSEFQNFYPCVAFLNAGGDVTAGSFKRFRTFEEC
jgi:hypothetical protein